MNKFNFVLCLNIFSVFSMLGMDLNEQTSQNELTEQEQEQEKQKEQKEQEEEKYLALLKRDFTIKPRPSDEYCTQQEKLFEEMKQKRLHAQYEKLKNQYFTPENINKLLKEQKEITKLKILSTQEQTKQDDEAFGDEENDFGVENDPFHVKMMGKTKRNEKIENLFNESESKEDDSFNQGMVGGMKEESDDQEDDYFNFLEKAKKEEDNRIVQFKNNKK